MFGLKPNVTWKYRVESVACHEGFTVRHLSDRDAHRLEQAFVQAAADSIP